MGIAFTLGNEVENIEARRRMTQNRFLRLFIHYVNVSFHLRIPYR